MKSLDETGLLCNMGLSFTGVSEHGLGVLINYLNPWNPPRAVLKGLSISGQNRSGFFLSFPSLELGSPLGLERIHQVTNTIRIAIQGGEYDTYREYTFSQRLN